MSATLLFEVEPTDPITFAAVSLLLAAASMPASDVPARRAWRMDPLVALKAGERRRPNRHAPPRV